MPTLKIGDKRVKVGEEFLSLPPDQQQAAVDEIAASIGISAKQPEPAKEPAPQPEKTWAETGIDAAKSLGTGVAQGAIGLASMPQDIGTWLGQKATGALDSLMGYTPQQIEANRAKAAAVQTPLQAPSGQQMTQAVEGITGPMYQPQTTAGQYARTIGEFIPGAAAGPGGIIRKAALAVIPGTASEAAGQATAGTAAEPYARFAGGLAGGIAAASKGGAPLREMRKAAPDAATVTAMRDQAYGNIKAAGIVFEPNAYKSTAMKIQSELRKHGLLPQQSGPDAALLNLVMERAKPGKINGWTEVDSIRQDAGAVAFGGRATEQEAARAKIIRKHLDDLVEKGQVMSLRGVPRDQVKPMVDQARELARRTIIARDIGKMQDKAEWYVSGPESGLRNQFASYGKKKGQYLTPAEEAAFKSVTAREGALNPLHMAGSRLGLLAMGGTGLGIGGPLGGILSPLASMAARKGMELYTMKGVNDAVRTVLSGKTAQKSALAASKKLKGQGRAQTLLATDSSRRSAQEPVVLVPYPSLLGQ